MKDILMIIVSILMAYSFGGVIFIFMFKDLNPLGRIPDLATRAKIRHKIGIPESSLTKSILRLNSFINFLLISIGVSSISFIIGMFALFCFV